MHNLTYTNYFTLPAIVASWRAFSYEVFHHTIDQKYNFFHTYEHNHYDAESIDSIIKELPSVPDFIDSIVTTITDIDEYIYTYKYSANLTDYYSKTSNSTTSRGVFTEYSYTLSYFKNWQLEKIIDKNSIQTFFKVTDWLEGAVSTSSASGGSLGKLGYSKSVIASSALLHTIITLEDTDETQDFYRNVETPEYSNAGFVEESLFNVFNFPLQDGYTADMTLWQIKAIYDMTGKKICDELPIQYPNAYIEDYSAYTNDDGNIDVNWGFTRWTYPDGEIVTRRATISAVDKQGGIFYYDGGKKQDYLMPNVSITKLSEKKYLIGFHGGNLYLSDNGKIKKITEDTNDKLKNFRLREMKNLNKAKVKE